MASQVPVPVQRPTREAWPTAGLFSPVCDGFDRIHARAAIPGDGDGLDRIKRPDHRLADGLQAGGLAVRPARLSSPTAAMGGAGRWKRWNSATF